MRYLAIASIVALINCVIIIAIYFLITHEISKKNAQLSQIQQEVTQFGPLAGDVENITQQNAALQNSLALINKLEKEQQYTASLLDTISNSIPEQVWLSELKKAGTNLSMSGYAVSADDLSQFMSTLQLSTLFSNITLLDTQRDSAGTFYSFQIASVLRGVGT